MTESFGGTTPVTGGVTGGESGGRMDAAAESGGFTVGGTDCASRDLLYSDAATVRPATSSAPAIHGTLERFGAAPSAAAAGYPSDRTTTVGSEPVIRVRYADVSSVAGRSVTSSCASSSPVAGRSSGDFCRQ